MKGRMVVAVVLAVRQKAFLRCTRSSSSIFSSSFNDAVRYDATVAGVTSLFAFVVVQPNHKHRFRKPPKWMKVSV